MNEHDARILGPKIHSVPEGPNRVEWGRKRTWCYACGAGSYGVHVLTTHEIIGGRGGRSQEPCNWLRLGMHPCHDLATGLSIRGDGKRMGWYLPKLTLAIQLTIKFRAGELSDADLERLAVLHGRALPALAPIPEFFLKLFEENRPDVLVNSTKAKYVHSWSRAGGRP